MFITRSDLILFAPNDADSSCYKILSGSKCFACLSSSLVGWLNGWLIGGRMFRLVFLVRDPLLKLRQVRQTQHIYTSSMVPPYWEPVNFALLPFRGMLTCENTLKIKKKILLAHVHLKKQTLEEDEAALGRGHISTKLNQSN